MESDAEINEHAMTLIELLVVVTIIAILAALILTSLANSRQQARGITCLSAKRQLTLAWLLYVSDNAGAFPFNAQEEDPQDPTVDYVCGVESWNADDTDNTNVQNLSCSLLGNYIAGQVKVYKCPSDIWLCTESNSPMERVRSVSMNCYVG